MRYALAILAALAIVAGFAVGIANAHQSVVNQGGVITWTHPNHAGDAIGAAACAQNRNGVTKCITTSNRIYKFRAPYPQVGTVPNPPDWDSRGSSVIGDAVVPGLEWWWTRAAGNPPGSQSGIAIYGVRRFPGGGGLGFTPAFAVVTPGDTTLENPLDGDAPGRTLLPRPTVLYDPPADFIRSTTALLSPDDPFVLPRRCTPVGCIPAEPPPLINGGGAVEFAVPGRPSVKVTATLHPPNLISSGNLGRVLASATFHTTGAPIPVVISYTFTMVSSTGRYVGPRYGTIPVAAGNQTRSTSTVCKGTRGLVRWITTLSATVSAVGGSSRYLPARSTSQSFRCG